MISGDRGGQGVGQSLPFHLFGNVASKNQILQIFPVTDDIKFLETIVMVKNYVCIPRSFLVINVRIKGKNLCSPCRLWDPKTKCYNKK